MATGTARLLLGLGSRHRAPLALTYALTAAENLAELLYPFLIGRAIDGLLAGRRAELVALGAVLLLHAALGTARHVYDTRVFTRVYGRVAGEMVLRQRAAGEDPGRVAARVGLTREIIDFFQVEVPALATATIRLGGVIFMLFALNAAVGLMALAALVPVTFAVWWFARSAPRLNGALNDAIEREVRVVARASAAGVMRHFGRLAFWRVRVSDAEARTWAVTSLAGVGLIVGALLVVTGQPGATVGSTFAVLGYVLTHAEIVDDLPNIVQNLARVHDIAARTGGDNGAVLAPRVAPAPPAAGP